MSLLPSLPADEYLEPVDAYWRDVLSWGRHNHVPLSGNAQTDLGKINKARTDFGLPPFRIIARKRRLEPLPHPSFGLEENPTPWGWHR